MRVYLRYRSALTMFTCCHTEIEVADQTFHLTQLQYTDTGPTSPSTDSVTPGARQRSHWSANFEVTGMTRPEKQSPRRKRDSNRGSSALEVDALTARPTRRSDLTHEQPSTVNHNVCFRTSCPPLERSQATHGPPATSRATASLRQRRFSP